MNNIGSLYQDGLGVAQDYAEAMKWYRKAAEKGNTSAKTHIGYLYADGIGVPQDYSEAAKWYKQASDEEDAEATACLGLLYEQGLGCPIDFELAVKHYKKAAAAENLWSLSHLGGLYIVGKGVPQDTERGVKLLTQAAEKGYAVAMMGCGILYRDGVPGVAQDYRKAMKWFRQAAEKGNAEAISAIGYMHQNGLGVPKDYFEAMKCYQQAAEKGVVTAINNIGALYYSGYGVPKDYSEAMKWYKRAADKGSALAEGNIGELYYFGQGVTKDYELAVKHFDKASALGDLRAKVFLGIKYGNGEGVPRDCKKGVQLITEAAEQGDEQGSLALAGMYLAGTCLSADPEKARTLLSKIADKSLDARFLLGFLYYAGLGAERNSEKAFQEFARAAEKGHLLAQTFAGDMQLNGWGVPRDEKTGRLRLACALDQSTERGDYGVAATIVSTLAQHHANRGESSTATELLGKLEEIVQKARGSQHESRVLTDTAEAHLGLGNFDQALEYGRKAIQRHEEAGQADQAAQAWLATGNAYLALGQYDKALDDLEKALAMCQDLSHLLTKAQIHLAMARVHNAAGRPRKALGCLKELEKIPYDEETHELELRIRSGVHSALGDLRKASDLMHSVLEQALKRGDVVAEGRAHAGLAGVFAALGRHDKARELAERSFGSIPEAVPGGGNRHLEMAGVYRRCRDYQKALDHATEAMKEFEKKALPLDDVRTLMGDILMDMNRLEEAEPHVVKAGKNPGLARLNLMKSNYPAAKEYYEKVLADGEESGSVADLFIAYTGLAKVHEALEDMRKAEEYYEKGMRLVEEMRAALSPGERRTFLDVRIGGFLRSEPAQGLTRVRMKMNEAAESIESSEVTRARAFSDRLSESQGQPMSGVPKAVLEQEQSLVQSVATLRQTRGRVSRKENPEPYAKLTKQIEAAEQNLRGFVEKLWKDFPAYAQVKYPRPVTLAASALRDDEHVIMFDVSEEGVGIKLIRGKEIVETHYNRWKLADLESDVQRFLKPFEEVEFKDFDPELGKSLYKKLLARVLIDVPKGTPITIIPDGVLALLPFEALVMEGKVSWKEEGKFPVPDGLTYVADAYPISYAQSITAITLARQAVPGSQTASKTLVMADPVFEANDQRLVGTDKSGLKLSAASTQRLMSIKGELGITFQRLDLTAKLGEALKKSDPSNTDVFAGLDASKRLLFEKPLEAYGRVVFATHGYFGRDLPGILEPVLVLTLVNQPEDKDGFLRMSEVMGLKLNADIVALTACQTGVGKVVSGEGTMNMGRAFQYAGAKSVLMTLWSVEQTASLTLVESFFKHLRAGKPKLEALRVARQEIREQGYDHPFFWAPFILVGEVQ